jgi:hypothetical protein
MFIEGGRFYAETRKRSGTGKEKKAEQGKEKTPRQKTNGVAGWRRKGGGKEKTRKSACEGNAPGRFRKTRFGELISQ